MRLSLLLLLSACTSAPVEMLPPPPAVTLEVTPVLANARMTMRITGATQGQTAYFFRGASAGGCGNHAQLPGTCINLTRPTLLDTVTVGSNGRAVLNGVAPAGARFDIEHAFQVILTGSGPDDRSRVVRRSNTDGCADPVDLSGVDLSNIQLARLDLSCANLSGANLTNADLTDADLFQADLSGATIAGALFVNANLSSADFSDVDGPGANFSNATAVRANFSNAWLDGSRFDNADFEWAVMPDAVAVGSWFEGASFQYAVLTDADFGGSAGRRLVLDYASVDGLSLRHTTLPELQYYALAGSDFLLDASHAGLVDCDLDDAKLILDHADIQRCDVDLLGGSARYARASDADLHNMADVDATGIQLDRADMQYNGFVDVNFTDAVLVGAAMFGARLTSVDLTGADLTGAGGTTNTTVNGVTFDQTTCADGRMSDVMPGARCF